MNQKINNIEKNFDTSKVSWLKSGGKIKNLIKIYNINDIDEILNSSEYLNEQFLTIGNFSNLLIKSNGFNGVGLKLLGDFTQITIEDESLLVGAGVLDNYFSKYCYQNSITGYEFLHTIPGSIGGNIYMNAGCYGQEIKDKLLSIIFYDLLLKKHFEKPIHDLDFKYRRGFQQDNTVILYGRFKKEIGEQESIKKTMKEYEEKRNLSQPQRVNCCGSIFKNPENMNAWKLIKSSLNDSFYNGPVKLSKKHSNFFENDPNIEADLIEQFIINVQHKVKQKYNLVLDPELKIIG
jgi:UDP-N-acetylmuramate dehydrogenase